MRLIAKSFLAAALIGIASTATAAIPENIYMWGSATINPSDWPNALVTLEKVDGQEGVFHYRGDMKIGNLFLTSTVSGNELGSPVFYLAPSEGSHIDSETNVNIRPWNPYSGSDQWGSSFYWQVPKAGELDITLSFTEDSENGLKASMNAVYVNETPVEHHMPEHVYMYSAAIPGTGWENALELKNEGEGVFTYHGPISTGELIFTTNDHDDQSDFYLGEWTHPHVINAPVKVYHGYPGWDYAWWIGSAGIANIKVTVSDEGETAAISLTYDLPEHIYMVGDAAPNYWDVENAYELTNEGNGKFSYTGPLWRAELKFLTAQQQDCVQIQPAAAGGWLTKTDNGTCFRYNYFDNRYWVDQVGTYKVELQFGYDQYGYPTVTSNCERIGDLPKLVSAVGHAVGCWEYYYPKVIYPTEENSDVYELAIDPVAHDECKHIKFTSNPGGADVVTHIVPTETDFNGNVKLVKQGDKLSYKEVQGNADPAHDTFWGLAAEDVKPMKVQLNTADKTISFLSDTTTSVSEANVNSFSVRCEGSTLVVLEAEGAVEVYDLSGRLVAAENGTEVRVSGLTTGLYIVKANGKSVKVIL